MKKLSNPIKSYKTASQTVTQTRQIVMLYDGTIRFLQQAKEAMASGAIEQRYLKLTKASEVIAGLQSCLDFERGGEAARILYDFYASVIARIFALHRSNDVAVCDHIIGELRDMREAWDKVDRGIEPGSASATKAATKEGATEEETAAAVISGVEVSA